MRKQVSAVEAIDNPWKERLTEFLEGLVEEAQAGELRTIFLVKIKRDGGWATTHTGQPLTVLQAVGMLESLKIDLLTGAETPGYAG